MGTVLTKMVLIPNLVVPVKPVAPVSLPAPISVPVKVPSLPKPVVPVRLPAYRFFPVKLPGKQKGMAVVLSAVFDNAKVPDEPEPVPSDRMTIPENDLAREIGIEAPGDDR